MHLDMHVGMCVNMCVGMRVDMYVNMCVDMYADMCVDMSAKARIVAKSAMPDYLQNASLTRGCF